MFKTFHRITTTTTDSGGNGFTIVELLIATLVFSMILLLITVGVIRFTQAYYGGIVQSDTQNVARTILENVSQDIQFDGGTVSLPQSGVNNEYYFCVGDDWYSFLPGWQLTGTNNSALHQTKHAFIENVPGNTNNPGDTCSGAGAQNFSNANVYGTELMDDNMRLANLTISQVGTGNLYKVDVRVVYGDDDLLYSPSGNALGPAAPDAACQSGISGSNFCAVSNLSTIVEQRVSN